MRNARRANITSSLPSSFNELAWNLHPAGYCCRLGEFEEPCTCGGGAWVPRHGGIYHPHYYHPRVARRHPLANSSPWLHVPRLQTAMFQCACERYQSGGLHSAPSVPHPSCGGIRTLQAPPEWLPPNGGGFQSAVSPQNKQAESSWGSDKAHPADDEIPFHPSQSAWSVPSSPKRQSQKVDSPATIISPREVAALLKDSALASKRSCEEEEEQEEEVVGIGIAIGTPTALIVATSSHPSSLAGSSTSSSCLLGLTVEGLSAILDISQSAARLLDLKILEKALLDCYGRFLINLPASLLSDHVHLHFQIQEAHWWYEDFWFDSHPLQLPHVNLKVFGLLLWEVFPTLQEHIPEHRQGNIMRDWVDYCRTIPLRGAILLNENLTKVLLVQGWKGGRWTFPRGKVDEEESDEVCAAREVMEEIGIDIGPLIRHEMFLERVVGKQFVKLFIVPGISELTTMGPLKRKEISEIRWIPISALAGLSNYKKTSRGASKKDGGGGVLSNKSRARFRMGQPPVFGTTKTSVNVANRIKFTHVAQFVRGLQAWVHVLEAQRPSNASLSIKHLGLGELRRLQRPDAATSRNSSPLTVGESIDQPSMEFSLGSSVDTSKPSAQIDAEERTALEQALLTALLAGPSAAPSQDAPQQTVPEETVAKNDVPSPRLEGPVKIGGDNPRWDKFKTSTTKGEGQSAGYINPGIGIQKAPVVMGSKMAVNKGNPSRKPKAAGEGGTRGELTAKEEVVEKPKKQIGPPFVILKRGERP